MKLNSYFSINTTKALSHWPLVRLFQTLLLFGSIVAAGPPALAQKNSHTTFQRIPTQFIAALGDPGASSGNGAQSWGLWRRDPGPRGVWLNNYAQQLVAANGIAPMNWKFDRSDWWLDENGLIMEKPDFPLAPGKYLVTGDREVTTMLTVYPVDADGNQQWQLANGARLYDVTHLPCRSAGYTPVSGESACSPDNARISAFPVTPGGPMPPVEGCHRQDYAVLFIIGIAVSN